MILKGDIMKDILLDINKDVLFYETDNFCLLNGNSLELIKNIKSKSIDMIFADPPYFLSNDGITCKSGKMVSVNKGNWDKVEGIQEIYKYNRKWIKECK